MKKGQKPGPAQKGLVKRTRLLTETLEEIRQMIDDVLEEDEAEVADLDDDDATDEKEDEEEEEDE